MIKKCLLKLSAWLKASAFSEDAQDWAKLEYGRPLLKSDLEGRLL